MAAEEAIRERKVIGPIGSLVKQDFIDLGAIE
jgi:hypothetical protein